MSRIRPILVLSVCLLTAVATFAQKPPTSGPPSSQPQVVVDSNGTIVGSVIETVNGLSKAYLRYPLANGSFVLLNATSGSLNGSANTQPAFSPNTASVFFTSTNCTGDAYVFYNVQLNEQLAPSQSMTLVGLLPSQLPPPALNPGCPIPFPADTWLYTRATGSCGALFDPTHTLTFNSYYGQTPQPSPTAPPNCSGAQPPITFPNQQFFSGVFTIYSPTENLSLNYKAPFFLK